VHEPRRERSAQIVKRLASGYLRRRARIAKSSSAANICVRRRAATIVCVTNAATRC
jgi:hypothetical protein